MDSLDVDPRRLGLLLGLGDLNRGEICHGYQNVCVCSDCVERYKNGDRAAKPMRAPKQPWELAA